MPEGDTIHRAARTLHRALAGRAVTRFTSVFPGLNRVDCDTPLAGRIVDRVEARGKHLLIWFSGNLVLHTHMRMSGSWHLYRPGERWRRPSHDMRVLIETADIHAVGFNVPVAAFATSATLPRVAGVADLGPDPLSADFSAEDAVRRIAERAGMDIADALLDQSAISGIGNVYKSEALFVARINPFRKVGDLTSREMAQLVDAATRLMRANVSPSAGTGIVTFGGVRRTTTGRRNAGAHLWVYGRGARPCRRCGAPIQRRKQGEHARSTYWCARCQPGSGAPAHPADAEP